MDTCLWYLDSSCSRHMTGDWSIFKVFESKKCGNVTFGDGSKSQIKGKGIISLPGCSENLVLYLIQNTHSRSKKYGSISFMIDNMHYLNFKI